MPSSALPMFGDVPARVEHVAPVSIHGDVYYDVRLAPDDGAAALAVRLAAHHCERPPLPGDHLRVSFLMGQASGTTFIA